MAAARGSGASSPHSSRKSAPLDARSQGTTLTGPRRASSRPDATAAGRESAAAAATNQGRVVTSKCVRKRASRPAFDATCCATRAAATIGARARARASRIGGGAPREYS